MSGEQQRGATRAVVEGVRGIRYDEIPDEALEVARHCLLDFLGTALAGSHEPLTEILVREVVRDEAASEATLIGRPERASRENAALVNGAAGHALDFDDTHTAMGGHPSVPVLPALLALAEDTGASGRDLLSALVAGVELECRVGSLLGAGHYAVGFHTTGTVGTFGAAAACAHLLGLSEEAWLHALGLAGTQAAGLKSGFGTMAKPLHAGRAASAGLLAATLARGGFTAQREILEMEQGFAATHAGAEPTAAALAAQPDHLLIRDTLFKYHAACYLTHAAIEAARELRQRHGLDPEQITAIAVEVHPVLLGVCNIQEPTTGLEGKFSLRATTALALLDCDTRNPETFSDSAMADPRLVALRDRVGVTANEALTPMQARVAVTSGAGANEDASCEAVLDTGVPAADLVEQGERLRRKFLLLATPVLGSHRAAKLCEAASCAQDLTSVSDLMRWTCPD